MSFLLCGPGHILIKCHQCKWNAPPDHFLSSRNCKQPALSSLLLPTAVEEAVRIITGGAPELAVEGNGPVESSAVLTKAVKRPNEDSDEDEEKGAVVPPVHDIYRARQQKRIR